MKYFLCQVSIKTFHDPDFSTAKTSLNASDSMHPGPQASLSQIQHELQILQMFSMSSPLGKHKPLMNRNRYLRYPE